MIPLRDPSASGRRAFPPLRASLAIFVAALVTATAAPAVASPERDAAEAAQVASIRIKAPHAAELLEQGESLAAAGALEDALKAFGRGASEDPVDGGLFLRRQCEALTALGRKDAAKTACWNALQEQRTPGTITATVRALVAGPGAPTFEEIQQALTLLLVERRNSLGVQPRLVAAMCDVAESIGDGVMLQHCTKELERIAPHYPPTLRARAALDAQCPPWRFWTGWIAIAAALLVTLADASRRWMRRRAPGVSTGGAAAGALLVFLLALTGTARADLPPAPPDALLSEWPVDDKDPEAHVPTQKEFNADPLQAAYWIQDLILKAELASKHGDHEAAVKYYRAMYKAVPDKAISLTRLCTEYDTLGDLNAATSACGAALLLDGLTINDYAHYVRLMLRKPGHLTAKEALAVSNVIDHLRETDAGKDAANELECELGVRMSDVDKLKECTAALAKTAPSDPKTIAFEWALAMQQSKFDRARELLTEAKAAGTKDENLKNMEAAVDAASKERRKALALTVVGALILAGALAYGLAMFARRRSVPAAA